MTRRARIVMIVLPVLAAGVLALAVTSIVRSNSPTVTADASLPGPAVPVPAGVVAGSGVVEPAGREVAVATSAPGIVREVRVKPGDLVKAGDVLFSIDEAVATAMLDQRRQDLAAAASKLQQTVARIPQLTAEADAARSAIEAAAADRDDAADQVQTGAQLVGGAVSQRELARRRYALRSAESRVSEIRARFDGAKAALVLIDPAQQGASYLVDQQAVAQARAAVVLAETERDRLVVRSPRDATILSVNIRPGEFAPQGAQSAPVTLGALTPLHVRVDIDEADLPRLRMGLPAIASRRGSRNERIPLSFLRAEPVVTAKRSLTGGSDERVDTRVLQLIYEVVPTDIDLRPGQLLDIIVQDAMAQAAGNPPAAK